MMYSGQSRNADYYVLALANQFVEFPPELQPALHQIEDTVKEIVDDMTPYKNRDLVLDESFLMTAPMSQRAFTAMNRNDRYIKDEELCSSVPMFIINGSLDAATPASTIDSYLSDKSCSSAKGNQSIIKVGGGHTVSLGDTCLMFKIEEFLTGNSSDFMKWAIMNFCKDEKYIQKSYD